MRIKMFQGNEKLRGEDDLIEYDQEMVNEMVKCSEDILYFAQKYCYIVDPDEGKVVINLYDYQKRVLKSLLCPAKNKKNAILLSPRQVGKTTMCAIYIMHYALYNSDKKIAILANKEKTAIEILSKVRLMYENLPFWVQVGLKNGGWNKTEIHLANSTIIKCASTASSAIRGETINLLMLDEYAFVPENIADEFMSSVYPTVSRSKTSKIVIVSTPNGLNHFYHIWIKAVAGMRDSEQGNSFFPIKINWWEVPGCDDEWKKRMIADIGLVKFNQEYACVSKATSVKVRNKKTNVVEDLSMGEIINRLEGRNLIGGK
jgi:hypothetical protein